MARKLEAPEGWMQPDCQEWFYEFEAALHSLVTEVDGYARGLSDVPPERSFREATTRISKVRKIMKEARRG